jgi:glycosyltransferase involved in cell wall biosynthesis
LESHANDIHMKLLIVNPFALTPDRQDYYRRLQVLTGWQITLLTARQWKNDYGTNVNLTRLDGFNARVIDLPVLLKGNIPLHLYRARLAPILRREDPDVVYVYHEPYGVATFQVFRAQPVGAAIGFYSSQNIFKRYPLPFRAMERYVLARADFAVTVSDRVSAVVRGKGYRGPLHVIPFAVDAQAFKPGAANAPRPSRGVLRVGFSGRLTQAKGVDTLLTALSKLPASRFEAVIVGKGPQGPQLRNLARRLGIDARIRWCGYVPHRELPSFYRQLDVLVVPSKTTTGWKEQFGRVVIEAQSCGVGVITSDSGELPHLVESTAGWTFPERDAMSLAALLQRLDQNRNELEEIATRGRLAVVRHYDLDAIVQRFASTMESVWARSLSERGS